MELGAKLKLEETGMRMRQILLNSKNNVKIINLTPHDINIVGEDNKIIKTFPKTGKIARCEEKRVQVGRLSNIPLYNTVLGEVKDLPESKPNTYYIVSRAVAEAMRLKVRNDLIIPDIFVRDSNGNIIGCKGFAKI